MSFAWSSTVEDYYPIEPTPRWGHGLPENERLLKAMQKFDETYRNTLEELASCGDLLNGVPIDVDVARPELPNWNNHWFSTLDAASLVGFISLRKPKLYVEIGSGFSTRFARYAISSLGLATRLVSVDPYPRAEIDAICDETVRSSLETCDVTLFDQLHGGDILFFDGSHRAFENSDVTVFFLEILPRLKPGVLVHIHDICLPDDYPPVWKYRLYSEQYVLAAMLLCPSLPFKIVLPNYYVATRPTFRELANAVLSKCPAPVPLYYNNHGNIPPVSFWIETL
ncbi:MAG: class I SAM-dependent methyltransferase [Methylovirgula sp.]|uniref:class I SAM-dependent methyltransferase n=1 Tax=Methylovirgula sp. TaxID=1978224 RepID=UPI003075F5AB